MPVKLYDFIQTTDWDHARGIVAQDLEGLHEAIRGLQDVGPDATNDDVQIVYTTGTINELLLADATKVLLTIGDGNPTVFNGFSGVWPGRVMYILYNGDNSLTIGNNSPLAVPNFRIFTNTGSDITLTALQAALLVYNPVSHYWEAFELGGGGTGSVTVADRTRQITVIIDGQGSPITSGLLGVLSVPVSGTITKWRILADQVGSIVLDVWKDTYANYLPTSGDSITAATKPTLSSVIKNEDTTLAGWTPSFSAGDIFRFTIDSASNVTLVTFVMEVVIS